MKFNFENFLAASATAVKGIYYIKDDDKIVRYSKINDLVSVGHQYHLVKWWACFELHGDLYLLLYLVNSRKNWTLLTWCDRRKYFLEILEILKRG